MSKFYSNGKLLISGEYVVLDGATALAVPTRFGQSMEIEAIDQNLIIWKSFDEGGNLWLEQEILFSELEKDIPKIDTLNPTETLKAILSEAKKLNPSFLNGENGYKVQCRLGFPRNWGLGSSSTLINNIANWASVNPYHLLKRTFGGSGYDIACARNDSPLSFKIEADKSHIIEQVAFHPIFHDKLYFVHLNEKQNSREQVNHYKNLGLEDKNVIERISDITDYMINCNAFSDFVVLMEQHEDIMSKALQMKAIKQLKFPDFNGGLKSLGAWGGDFILAASEDDVYSYFQEKGFNTILKYEEMILT